MATRRRAIHVGLVAAVLINLVGFEHAQWVEASGGTFGTPSTIAGMRCCIGNQPQWPRATQIADMNRDGIPDLLVANDQGTVDVYLGHGDGTFGLPHQYAAAGGPIALSIGDVNNDGFLDVAVGDDGTGSLSAFSILLGNGDGTLRAPITRTMSGAIYAVSLGDLNGDGKLDLVVGDAGGPSIGVLFGNGDGTFGAATLYATHGESISTTLADLNGDGRLDVVSAEGDPPGAGGATLGVFLNAGNGVLGTRVDYGVGSTYARIVTVAVGDLNNDGVPDLVADDLGCSFDGGHLTILAGRGGGAFTGVVQLDNPCVDDVAIADVTGDGITDVVSVAWQSGVGSYVSVYPGNGDGTVGTRVDYLTPTPLNDHAAALNVADVNRDGKPDALAFTGDPIGSVFLNVTPGAFRPIGGDVTPAETMGGNPCHACWARRFVHGSWAEPIDSQDGNFTEQYGDLVIPGRGFPLAFVRTYNSLAANVDGPLGFGWTHSYNASLAQDAVTGRVTVTQETGSKVVFAKVGTASPATYGPVLPRTIATLKQNGDGSWTFVRQASETLRFSTSGLLTALVDRNGYTTSLAYNGSNQLSTITDPAGRSFSLAYTGAHLVSVSDMSGRQVRFEYDDGQGNLTDVYDVDNGHTIYTYDTAHHILTVTDPRRNVVTTNHYDGSGRVDEQWDGVGSPTTFQYAPDGSSTVITDPRGRQVLETYAFGVRTSITRGYGSAQAATWSFTYDPYTLGVIGITDPNGHSTYRTYDASGNVIAASDGLGRTTTFAHNAFNEPTVITDPLSVSTTMTYDAAGNLRSRSTPLVGTSPLQVQTTQYIYGDATHPGDMTSSIDPDGRTWRYGYDADGDLSSTTDPIAPNGDTTTTSFNALGWPTSTVSPKGNVPGCGCASSYTTTFSYADPQTQTVDNFGDVRVVTDPLGHTMTTTYDAARNVTDVTDGEGRITHTQFDADNRSVAVTHGYGTPQASTATTDYWPDGTVKDQVDGRGSRTSYDYDAQGRMTSITRPVTPLCTDGCPTTYAYDAGGNLHTMTDAQSPARVTTYSYDAADQLQSITYSDGTTPNVTSIGYDADGQRTQMTDGTGTSHWAYDSLHRLTSYQNGAGATVGYGFTYGTPIAYELLNRVRSITYPDGNVATRTYDDAGRVAAVSDWLGNTTQFQHDQDSNVKEEDYPTGVTTLTWDQADRLMGISLPGMGFVYGRENNNQLDSVSSTGVADTHSYTYTPLNQVSGVDGSGSYIYDLAGNPRAFPDQTAQTFDPAEEISTSGQILLVGSGSKAAPATSTGNLSVPFNMAGGTAGDDTVVLGVTIPGDQSITAPAGYTLVAVQSSGTGSLAAKTDVYVHKAVAGEASVSVGTGTTPFAKTAVAAIYRGVATVSPVDAVTGTSAGTATSLSVPALTAADAGDRLVVVAGATSNKTAETWQTPVVPSVTMSQVASASEALSSSALADGFLAVEGTYGPVALQIGDGSVGTAANLTGIALALSPSTTTYGFDRRGNRTSVTPPSGHGTTISLSYDQANRLVSYNGTATHAYDGDGLRMSKTVGNSPVERFAYDETGGLPLLLQDGPTDFVYGPGDQVIEAVTPRQPITPVSPPTVAGQPATTAMSMLPVTLPAGIQAGDEIVLAVSYPAGLTNSVSVPSGYSQFATVASGGSGTGANRLAVFLRRATGSEGGTTVNVPFNAPFARAAVAAAYRGVDPDHMVDVSQPGNTNQGSTVTTSGTTRFPGDEWVVLQGASYLGATAQPFTGTPAGMTEEAQANLNATITAGIADASAGAPGNTGSLTSTFAVPAQLTTLLIAFKTPPLVTYHYQDQLGSTRLLTDQAGTQLATFTFDPYGRLTASTGTATTPILYAGQYRDSESGLYYMRARYYDPGSGQFLTLDPADALTGQPYKYADDNALNWRDPGGLDPWGEDKAAISREAQDALRILNRLSSKINELQQDTQDLFHDDPAYYNGHVKSINELQRALAKQARRLGADCPTSLRSMIQRALGYDATRERGWASEKGKDNNDDEDGGGNTPNSGGGGGGGGPCVGGGAPIACTPLLPGYGPLPEPFPVPELFPIPVPI
jgi:RHS repeat-associated protein